MLALQKGLETARTLSGGPSLDLAQLLERFDLEMLRRRFQGRLREVIIEGAIGIDERLPALWVRWLTAHAIGHHLLHTGTWLYLDAWQWVATLKAEHQAEEFAAGLLMPPDSIWLALGPAALAPRLSIPESKAAWSWRSWTRTLGSLAKEKARVGFVQETTFSNGDSTHPTSGSTILLTPGRGA